MRNKPLQDEQLLLAAKKVVLSMATVLPEVPEYTFSERFLAKMAQLVAKSRKPDIKQNTRKRIAAAVIIALLSAFAIIGFNPSARAAIKEWFKETIGNIYTYWIKDEAVYSGPMEYKLGWIPDGYEIMFEDSSEMTTTYIYQTATTPVTDWITFSYTKIDPETPANLIALGDEYTIEEVRIWKYAAGELYINTDGKDTNTLIWFDTERNIVFTISTYLGKNEILKIADNILKIPIE